MDSFGRNELHYLILDRPESEHEVGIKIMVESGLDVNSQDKKGWSALHFAAQENSIAAVKTLLDCGAKTEVTDSFGNTPLFRAVFSAKGEDIIIKLLIAAGADPDSVNKHGVSPRILASTIGNLNIVQCFE